MTADAPLRLALVTDAWAPQVNGVVKTLEETVRRAREMGHAVTIIEPGQFTSIRMPGYREIELAFATARGIEARLGRFKPNVLHVATEGPLGWAARRYARSRGLPITTAFHTRFPDYIHARAGVPRGWSFAVMRRFHAPARRVMVATESLIAELRGRGFANLARWSRGVDLARFAPGPRDALDLPRPIALYVGRVAVEKNLPAFLALDLPGTKVVIGDGPSREALQRRFPDTRFLGAIAHEDLAPYYRAADLFVFPSRTDTFGLVLVEAMACGTPVAAYPVAGPRDVVTDGGVLDHDLRRACLAALDLPRSSPPRDAARFSWESCTAQFIDHLRAAI